MLQVRDIALSYGAEPVLENVSLDVRSGEFVSLVGPSGSGKTSVLRAVTGLQTLLEGDIALDIEPTEVGFLFQDDA
ncbi:MAG: ATP-binding cassette domain-containing protein, partial [Kiloniellales bacterium]